MSFDPMRGKQDSLLGDSVLEILDQALKETTGRGRGPGTPDPDGEPVFHAIDYLDVALSAKSVFRVQRAARRVARTHMPEARLEQPMQALALFLDHVYWEEGSGGLYLCADLDRVSFCLPIPSGEWSLRKRPGPVQ